MELSSSGLQSILLRRQTLVDFSSPESSGAMDFLYYRAAIIGDSITRMLEFSDVKVMCASHVTAYESNVHSLTNKKILC